MLKLTRAVVAVLLFWNLSALAGTPVENSCDVAPDCRVVIKNVAGLVQVQSWDQNRVDLKGTLGEDVTRLDFTGGNQLVTIEVVIPHPHGNRIASELTISVPATASLDVEAVSADIRVYNIAGEIEASTVSGDLTIENAANAVRASSVSGDVEISDNGPSVTVKTTSGEIEISGEIGVIQADSVSGSVDVSGKSQRFSSETISGDITVAGAIAEVKAKTISGDIEVEKALQQAEANTVSGDIDLDAGQLVSGGFSSESGDVEFDGEMAEMGKLRAFSRSGSLVIRIPENPTTAVEARTLSGGIRNAFGPAPQKGIGPGRMLQFGPAEAVASVSLETMSGDITLERK